MILRAVPAGSPRHSACTAEHKGCDLLGDGPVTLEFPAGEAEMIMVGPRVGVSVEADRPWRFWIGDSPFVSDYKRSPRAPRVITGSPIARRWDHP